MAEGEKPLFIPLKSQFYEQFVAGTKRIEYRKYGPRWNESTCPIGRAVTISKGYGTKHRRSGKVVRFEQRYMNSNDWLECYGEPGTAACIHIELEG